DQLERFFPSRRSQLPLLADQRLRQSFFVACEIEGVPALNAEEIPVRAALVAVVSADDFHAGIRAPYAQSRLTPVAAVRADGAHVLHLPGASLIPICARGECAHRADVDAHAALFALQMIFFIRSDQRTYPAVLHAKSPNIHALAADTNAAVTKDASR